MRLAAAIPDALPLPAAPPSQARDDGDWSWRVGVHNVRSKSDKHDGVKLERDPSRGLAALWLVDRPALATRTAQGRE